MESMAINNFDSFYNGRRVLVTGHTGFKGSWLSLWLQKMGAAVSGYALPPNTDPSLYQLLNLGIPETLADINDEPALAKHFKDYAPEVVFHLAAQPLVRESYSDPIGTWQTNIASLWNLLKIIKNLPSVKVVVIITTDKCYQNLETGKPFVETDALGGHDPYSASKACVEILCASWRASFFQPAHGPFLSTVRAGNVIGGGDWAADRLIPDCIKSFIAGQAVELRNPNALRPWQHVLEPLAGYLTVAEKLYNHGDQYAEAWNFGPGVGGDATVGDVATVAAEIWGDGRVIKSAPTDNLHEANLLRLDIAKSVGRLGWVPRWDVKQAIFETVDWYKAWHDGKNMLEFSLRQIEKYKNS